MSEQFDHSQMYYGASAALLEFARNLRLRETEAEKLLWTRLSKKQVNGLRFRRQHPVLYFIADFFCPGVKLVIEVDGGIHRVRTQFEYDKNRDNELTAFGLRVVRFTNEEVFNDIENVIAKIGMAAEEHLG